VICLQVSPQIGAILKRKSGGGPSQIKIVGQRDGCWIAEPLDFGPPIQLTANELRVQYGSDGASPADVDEQQAWKQIGGKSLDAAMNAARVAEREQAASALAPEDKLATEAAAENG
jgi:hypothetical protein